MRDGAAPPLSDSVRPPAGLVDHFFRHEYGRLVAHLVRKVGVQKLELVEDAVQSALLAALTAWAPRGLPDDPGAWLYRAAFNQLVGTLRKHARQERILERTAIETSHEVEASELFRFKTEVHDDVLRMLFACAEESLPRESRVVLALKTLCGFSAQEIASGLFTTEANVQKRLQRAREQLKAIHSEGSLDPPLESLVARLPSVHEVLYLLFNEGYLSSHAPFTIRRDLCEEAVRLATLLAEHPVGATAETHALVALMHLHAARFDARTDESGGLLLLEEQARERFDTARITVGLWWLERSAKGEAFSRYHAEAGIAAEHCLASSFETTRWSEIAALYQLLEERAPSPLHQLNRAIAVAEWKGPEEALAILDAAPPPSWLERSYLWNAVLADLHRRSGHREPFELHRARAVAGAPNEAVRILLERRLSNMVG